MRGRQGVLRHFEPWNSPNVGISSAHRNLRSDAHACHDLVSDASGIHSIFSIYVISDTVIAHNRF